MNEIIDNLSVFKNIDMSEETKQIRLERLDKCITEMRSILNEISATLNESEKDKEWLILSRCLDELIVEYMKQVKTQNRGEK